MAHIVISYSSKNRDLVTALASDLESLGHDVWFDAELTRTGGQKWWSNILANICQCDVFIFALTSASLASEPCKREYGYAYALHKRIVPVMLESVDVSVLPAALQEIQFVDYRERNSKQGIALAGTLANLPLAQPLPDPLPPEPQTPLSPLAQISQHLDEPSLTGSAQIEIFFELERLFNDRVNRASAEVMLRRLLDRDDLTNRVGERIRALLQNVENVPHHPPAPAAVAPRKTILKPKEEPSDKPPTSTTAGAQRQREAWSWRDFLVPVLISIYLVALGILEASGRFQPWEFRTADIQQWFMPLFFLLAALNLVGIWGMWKWHKWGVYLLAADYVLSAISHIYMMFSIITWIPSIRQMAPWIFAIFTVLIFALVVLWRVSWKKWQYFEGRTLVILGRKF